MKKSIILIAAFAMSMGALAQYESDVLMTSRTAPTGTARSIGLSNAMGAVGGDLSAIGINPAGIGIYRTSDLSITTGLQTNTANSKFLGNNTSDNSTTFALSQLGFVSTYKTGNDDSKGIVSSHFGFGYNRLNNFNQNIWLNGVNVNNSMLDMLALDANGYSTDDLMKDPNAPIGSKLAYQAWLINPVVTNINGQTETTTNYFHDLGYTDDDGNFHWAATDGLQQNHIVERRGNGGEYAFTGGLNIGNTVLVGATFGFQNFRMEQTMLHEETVVNGPTDDFYYLLENFSYFDTWNRYGTSTNVKLGVIVKPINAVRLGFSFHSPNWYQIREEYYTEMSAQYSGNQIYNAQQDEVGEFEYKLTTPMKLIGSLALVSKVGFFSIDYEFQDYSTAKFKPYNNDIGQSQKFMLKNQAIKSVFAPTHTIKAGAELKLNNLLLRSGIGIYTSPYKDGILVDPMLQKTYSAGFGYRQQSFYIDLGYMMVTRNEEYTPYDYNIEAPENQYLFDDSTAAPEIAMIKNTMHNVMMTIGFKF